MEHNIYINHSYMFWLLQTSHHQAVQKDRSSIYNKHYIKIKFEISTYHKSTKLYYLAILDVTFTIDVMAVYRLQESL
jgi:hypothetical protein